MENVNNYISKIKEPFWQIFPRNLCLLSNAAGEIQTLWGRGHAVFDTVISFLSQQKNIFDVFDTGAIRNFRQLKQGSTAWPIRKNIEHFEFTGDFYTDLPILWIRVFPVEDDLFLGVARVAEFLPNMQYANANVVIYIDRENRLRAFNQNFFRLFQQAFRTPSTLLNRPASDFLDPTPAQIQAAYLTRITGEKPAWSPGFRFQDLPADKIAPYRTAQCRFEGGKIHWKNAMDLNDFISFLSYVDTSRLDFRFSVTFEIKAGSAPLLLLGHPKVDLRDPDYEGYLSGESAARDAYIFKKRGFTLVGEKSPAPQGRAVYALVKIGRALVFEVNGSPVLRFYDPNFIQHKKASLSIALRPGSEAVIDEVVLLTKETSDGGQPFGDADTIVKIKSQPPRYFALTDFHNNAINTGLPSVAGYVMNDVTDFRDKVEQYRTQYERERQKGSELESLLSEYGYGQGIFVGESKAILNIKEKARLIAGSAAPVLIEGATGTGKEVLARFIHDRSPRKDGPFIKVDCSTLPRELIESELFGHEKGAFTGAVERKIGRFEQAAGGTIFMDEISNLTRDIQAKLLNVLQDLSITRIGGNKVIELDVRIVAASNLPLENLIRTGVFREDLFYRINTIAIHLPPLKDRREDIPRLCQYFIDTFSKSANKSIKGLSPGAFRLMYDYAWPGNIRELRNVIQRAVIFCEGDTLNESQIQLPEYALSAGEAGAGPKRTYHLRDMTREKLVEVVNRQRGVVSGIARELGISRQACYDNFERFKVDPREARKPRPPA